jgi:hypothetical protein
MVESHTRQTKIKLLGQRESRRAQNFTNIQSDTGAQKGFGRS